MAKRKRINPKLGVTSRYVGLKAKLQLCNKNKQRKMEWMWV